MAQTAEGSAPACFRTGGGALEICRDGSEAEGVFWAPPACAFARGVQVLRLASGSAAGPLQVIYHGETPPAARRGREACAERRATDPMDSGAVHAGRGLDQLATTMPPAEPRLWEAQPEPPRPAARRGRRGRETADEPETEFGVAARNPIAVAGRDWAGEAYHHVFLISTVGSGDAARRVQIQARTTDFESFEIRGRGPDGSGVVWTPFGAGQDRRRGSDAGTAAIPSAVIDETGRPVVGNCASERLDAQGLSGSISVIDQTYHYIYTDAMPQDCGEPSARRRTALYLRTARDLGAPRVWSAPRTLMEGLPPGIQVRAARAKGMDRWVLSYSCLRPANAPGGPVPDICAQYSTDLSPESLGALKLFAEPVSAQRSPAYLGLRSGGDGSGRYGRVAHYWMTDRYGNLDLPGSLSAKSGFLTWLDRLAPRRDGSRASALYGRPVYWATWTVRAVAPR
ncbi:hypothetical protein DK427_08105 [Methylobacterium radiodurans]|uniref:Uncharacterized protein n=1 Tax=Methylobacterium radiodurans TaxID=2202828 RepID=A0A2U8VYP4_9HYPH|nr:hypothetical protein DK427_08105 [Methylobacterium radiodurans]